MYDVSMKEQKTRNSSLQALSRDRESSEDALFDAVLEPHRSLSRSGFLTLMTAIVVISFAAGFAFALMGAWPVIGFFGLDAALVLFAFKVNYRDARMYETVRLTEEALTVVRVNASGRIQRWSFQPYWLKVDIDDDPGQAGKLRLTSHGKSLVIGAFLAPHERADFARALETALYKMRQPPAVSAAE
jgi:uncharacterized membrane protein